MKDESCGQGVDSSFIPHPSALSPSPADKVVIAYLIIIAAFTLIRFERVDRWWLIVAGHALAVAGIVLMARLSARAPASLLMALLRGWYPVALIPILFKELTYLIPLLHPTDYDWQLAAIDYRMFGVHPTVWLERVSTPLLTEIFQLSYTTYYFMPLALGAVLWRKRWFERFHFVLFVVVLGFFLSYLGYIAVPATGPRFILAGEQTEPLRGLLFYDTIRETLDSLEGITRDCFPSGHTELTLLVLYYARRFHRPTFWLLIAPGSALVISTVYLRYHYVIDVFAGALLAFIIVVVAKPLYRAFGGKPLQEE